MRNIREGCYSAPRGGGRNRGRRRFYEERREGLGRHFREHVELGFTRIQQNPKAYPPYKDSGFRKHNLDRFPFSIFYQELEEVIWVAAVAHQKRRPDYWVHRTPDSG